MSTRPHFDDVFEFLDGFDSTASSDLSFDSFAGLLDLGSMVSRVRLTPLSMILQVQPTSTRWMTSRSSMTSMVLSSSMALRSSTASSDLSFNSFAGLFDLSLIDGLAFFDDLDLIRFLSIFNDPLHLDRGNSWGFRCSLPGQRHIVGS